MNLTRTTMDFNEIPEELLPFLSGAALYDSSCSAEARVVFADKYGGYFLKYAAAGTLSREAAMTDFFHKKGFSAAVVRYISGDRDWLLTEKLRGDDCTAPKYLVHPERLCDAVAERLVLLHGTDRSGCPVLDHTKLYVETAMKNYRTGNYDRSLFPDNWGYKTAEEAIAAVESGARTLKTDTLLHGDYCLPNIILDDWRFSGVIDVGGGGVGDRHVDIFWALWSLWFNLKTDAFRERFIDAYGRAKIDEDALRVVAAIEALK